MDLLSLVTLIVILALIGFALYVVTTYIPMPEPFSRGLVVVVVLLVLLWLVRAFVSGVPLLPVHR
jgi:uncharacterized membrane protein